MAARLFGPADWVASENRVEVWPPPEERDYAGMVATQDALGGTSFAHAIVEGESMPIEEAIALIEEEPDGNGEAAGAGPSAEPLPFSSRCPGERRSRCRKRV